MDGSVGDSGGKVLWMPPWSSGKARTVLRVCPRYRSKADTSLGANMPGRIALVKEGDDLVRNGGGKLMHRCYDDRERANMHLIYKQGLKCTIT
jgi:hypothetical protein